MACSECAGPSVRRNELVFVLYVTYERVCAARRETPIAETGSNRVQVEVLGLVLWPPRRRYCHCSDFGEGGSPLLSTNNKRSKVLTLTTLPYEEYNIYGVNG